MAARERLHQLKQVLGPALHTADIPADGRLITHIAAGTMREACRHLFQDLHARYVVSLGIDDRPYSGHFLVAHNFAFDAEHLLLSLIAPLPPERPAIDSITDLIPGAGWAEREFRDLLGIEPLGHRFPKRLVLPDGWPDGVHPLRKDLPWNHVPAEYDAEREFGFDDPPEGCTVVPLGPFHPTLDEPAHFRLFIEGETVRGCEYRGFMVHRGIEKLAESVLTYNEIPMAAERICGICGCVHNVAYAQAVEEAAAIRPPPRAEFVRTIFLELERLHSHLLWVGLAGHILGFDTLFMHCFRIREPVMWASEQITGNRKTYALCLIGGVRWDLSQEQIAGLGRMLEQLEREWTEVDRAVRGDRNLQRRTVHIGVADRQLVQDIGLLGPVARAAGVDIDARRDHPYAAYDRVDFDVVLEQEGDVWSRILVRTREVFESIRILRQCLDRLPAGPIQAPITDELPVGRIGLSSVEAPRGESHHFVLTGENNRPRRWRVRAPTYQNLQGVPAMIRGQQLADMTITLGSIDPCFSCTDRLELLDVRTGRRHMCTGDDLKRWAESGRGPLPHASRTTPPAIQRRPPLPPPP